MNLSGEYTFDASRETVWAALQDPDVLGSIMPGGEGFKEVGDDEFAGALNLKVGPVQGKFDGTIKLTDKVPPESYNIQVDGKGGPGFVKATGGLKLADLGEKTQLTYSLDAQIGGRIASVGQRLVDASARSIARQSMDALNAYLKGQASSPSAHNPPSQSRVALNVARDVAADLIPARNRPVVIAVGVLLAAAILYFIFR